MAYISESWTYEATAPVVDTADCALRAVCVAANADYGRVFKLFEEQGRKPNRGTKRGWIINVLNYLKPARCAELDVCHTFRSECGTLDQFVRSHPRGRWVVCVTGHAVAVVDGVVHDWAFLASRGRRKVLSWHCVD